MNEQKIKISGKRTILPAASDETFVFCPGGWILIRKKDGTQKKVQILKKGKKIGFFLDGGVYHGEIEIISKTTGDTAQAGSDADLVAQFPGKVRKLLVQPGQKVSEGDPLVLVEAMKMEFSIKAPYSGKIDKIEVQEGQQVSPGVQYLTMKADSS